MTAAIVFVIIAARGGGDARRVVGPHPARVRARRRLPPRAAARREGPGPDPAHPGHRPDGPRRPADGHVRHPAPGPDHARQRPRQGQRGLLLPRGRRRRVRSSTSSAIWSPRRRSPRPPCARCSGKADLDMLLSEREQLNEALQHIVDEHTDPWGIKVTTVEIKDVEIPQAMQRAMAPAGRGRARAAGEGHPRRGRVPGLRSACATPPTIICAEPRGPAAPLHADADRDRLEPELDDRLPAPDRPAQAVPRGRARASPRRKGAGPRLTDAGKLADSNGRPAVLFRAAHADLGGHRRLVGRGAPQP